MLHRCTPAGRRIWTGLMADAGILLQMTDFAGLRLILQTRLRHLVEADCPVRMEQRRGPHMTTSAAEAGAAALAVRRPVQKELSSDVPPEARSTKQVVRKTRGKSVIFTLIPLTRLYYVDSGKRQTMHTP